MTKQDFTQAMALEGVKCRYDGKEKKMYLTGLPVTKLNAFKLKYKNEVNFSIETKAKTVTV